MNSRRIGYQQIQFFAEDPSLVANKIEDHWFDRKSIRISPEALANVLIGFANADGGTLVIGVENDGTVTGVDAYTDQVNKLRQAAVDFTSPPVRHSAQFLSCTRDDGTSDHVLAIEVPPSPQLHRNNRDESYLRVGDQNRKLTLEATQELLYDNGNSVFDGLAAPESDLGDLDPAPMWWASATSMMPIGAGERSWGFGSSLDV